MKIYDISQEVFSCVVYPDDPVPQKERFLTIVGGDGCNATKFSMCAHNGTHVDAPNHFYADGKTVDQVALERFVGSCYVAECNRKVTEADIRHILGHAKEINPEAAKRILIKGSDAELSIEAARVLAEEQVLLYGNESQTVGPFLSPREHHLVLLGAEIVLLEGIRLGEVPEGVYMLNAAPINLGGTDGAPCRAILIDAEI